MADNSLPFTIASKLPKECYIDLNEFAQDLAKVLVVDFDLVSVQKGADGEKGEKGTTGSKGDKGDAGKDATTTRTFQSYDIPNGASYVDIPSSPSWQSDSYIVGYDGQIASTDSNIPVFDEAVIGHVRSVVAKYGEPVSEVRVYLGFSTGTTTPDENYRLYVSGIQ